MAAGKHLAKDKVGIVGTAIRALGVGVIYPGVNDNFAASVEAEKQTVLLEELRATPMGVCGA